LGRNLILSLSFIFIFVYNAARNYDGGIMKVIFASMVVAGLFVAGSAMATDMPDLAKKNGCNACHTIDKKLVGPAWMDVSKKYKGVAGAEAQLITKVTKGGGGAWSAVPMPPQDPTGKKQDAIKELVKFILSLAK
jgi:cytochrome c